MMFDPDAGNNRLSDNVHLPTWIHCAAPACGVCVCVCVRVCVCVCVCVCVRVT